MKFTIIGAGMAGLLAANMLGDKVERIIEAQDGLPNNHRALLRFRTPSVGDTVNIPFRRVTVMKCASQSVNDVADAIAYAKKVTGRYTLRSSALSFRTELVERWIAPPDFIDQMASNVDIDKYDFGAQWSLEACKLPPPYISTVPMPQLMSLLDYPEVRPNFQYREGYSVRFDLEGADAYVSVYIVDKKEEAYRVSITGNTVIVEYANALNKTPEMATIHAMYTAERFLGIDSTQSLIATQGVFPSNYAKIAAIDEDQRRQFITWASLKHGVFSLGRYATWRPHLMMDDCVNDVRVINRLSRNPSIYEQLLRS